MNVKFDTMTDEQLDKLIKIANVAKIVTEIESMKNEHDLKMADLYAKIESMSYSNAKLEAERAKLEKETRLYPAVAVFLAIVASVGMIVAALIR